MVFQHAKKQNGFSLIEVALVLLVVAALAVSALTIYRVVNNNQRTNETIKMIYAVYQAGANYNRLPLNTALVPRFIRDGYLGSEFDTNYANPWGGPITAEATSRGRIDIILEFIPLEVCRNLVTKFENLDNVVKAECTADVGRDGDGVFSLQMIYLLENRLR